MNSPSEEQQKIIDHIIAGRNVQVDACAGSGKSTTIFSTIDQMPSSIRFILITYNKMLRFDALEKIKDMNIHNVEIHTFHSLAVKYYLTDAHTDCGIRKIIYSNKSPRILLPKIDVLVLDEAQDISMLYFSLAAKMMMDAQHPFQLFVLGDYRQCLYEFKGADIRFLTQYDRLWKKHPFLKSMVFESCTLRTSYRITNEMAQFVNHVMLGETRLIATKTNSPVLYLTNTKKNVENMVVFHIRDLLETGAKPDEIFVLGASTRGAQMKRMENVFVEYGIPCHVPIFETEEVDEKVISGKIVFSTFHSVKGRQRKYVFIVGFDHSYFTWYDRNHSPNQCPNTLYVGCTRATDRLFLMEINEHREDRPLPFLKMNHHEMKNQPYIHFKGNPKSIIFADQVSNQKDETNGRNEHFITPTNLIRFLPETVLMKLAPLMDSIFICENEAEEEINTPNIVSTSNGYHEEVSDLNGIAIPSMYYDHLHTKRSADDSSQPLAGSAILYDQIFEEIASMKPNQHSFLKSAAKKIPPKCQSPEDYLYLANVYVSIKERIYFKINQIQKEDYRWLQADVIKKCIHRLDRIIGPECRQEKPLIEHTIVDADNEIENDKINAILAPYFPGKKFKFVARADLITEKCLWEIKCTSTLSDEHRLQLIIYAWLWRIIAGTTEDQKRKSKHFPQFRRAKLINIKTGEIMKLEATFSQLTEIMVELLRAKYVEESSLTDDQLQQQCETFLAQLNG